MKKIKPTPYLLNGLDPKVREVLSRVAAEQGRSLAAQIRQELTAAAERYLTVTAQPAAAAPSHPSSS